MCDKQLNEQITIFLNHNKALQNETYRIVQKMAETPLTADNGLMLKNYMDHMQYLITQLHGITYDIRVKLHQSNG